MLFVSRIDMYMFQMRTLSKIKHMCFGNARALNARARLTKTQWPNLLTLTTDLSGVAAIATTW